MEKEAIKSKDPLEKFKEVYNNFAELCARRGEVTEEDTRANVIDRLIHEVLGWPRPNVNREVYVKPGFIDYELSVGIPKIVIEAKRSGKSFVFPHMKNCPKSFKISGSLITDKNIKEAMEQTQRYCSDKGIPFGVTTNGYSFIIFRGIFTSMAWRDGVAIVFTTRKEIESRFTEFWNLLSYEAVSANLLEETFRPSPPPARAMYKPIDLILSSDAVYGRNPLNVSLRPYIEKFFGDIAAQDSISILEKCYVQSSPLQLIDKDLMWIISDSLPKFAKTATQIKGSPTQKGGQVELDIKTALEKKCAAGMLMVIMGGIGSGKSTFLKRFFKVVAKELVAENGPALEVYVDFLGAPLEKTSIKDFFWNNLSSLLEEKIPSLHKKETLEFLFKNDLSYLEEIYKNNPETLQNKKNDALFNLVNNKEKFAFASLNYCISIGRLPIIIFDNVDQLGLEAQLELYNLSQQLARSKQCLSILVLREESYCTAQMQKQLTAYPVREYHLSSPSFRNLISIRIDLAIKEANATQREQLLTETGHDQQQVIDFFNLLKQSMFERNQNIIRLIEAISFGNTRIALELLNAFVMSGATNMTKILDKFKTSGTYIIPFHEFIKSVVLGDYRYYKELRGNILNLFSINSSKNASHFTTLRILNYLSKFGKTTFNQEGFIELRNLIRDIADIFDNEQDCLQTIEKLIGIRYRLVELDTCSTENITGASLLRITTAGLYYLKYLANSFQYLDLVMQDTAFNDKGFVDWLETQISITEMKIRFQRVEGFLDYLNTEETIELKTMYDGGIMKVSFAGPFVPKMLEDFFETKKKISKSLTNKI